MLFSEALRRPVMSISSATSWAPWTDSSWTSNDPRSSRGDWQGRIRSSSGTGSRVSTRRSHGRRRRGARRTEGSRSSVGRRRFALLNKRVLDDRGDESGTVHDVDFDPESGRVTSVITSTGSLDGDRLIGCGPYAVVVRAADAANS